jgi:hypothetical protein
MINTEEFLNTEVSYQANIKINNIQNMTINDFLNDIKIEKYKIKITELRNQLKNGNFEGSKLVKQSLPAATFSGLFKNRHTVDSIVKYNKICVIDIDHITSDVLGKLLIQFKDDPYIIAFWISPSGNGIKGLVQFKFNIDVGLTGWRHHHKNAFLLLQAYFKENYNIEIDKSGSDVTRFCFISADKNLIIKKASKEFEINNDSIVISTKIPTEKHNRSNRKYSNFVETDYLYPNGKNMAECRYRIQRIILFLKKRNLSITFSYDEWFRVAYAIADTFTYDIGEKYYLRLCELDGSRYDRDQSIKMLRYCYQNSKQEISFATIEHHFSKTKEEWGRRTDRGYTLCVP